MSKIRFAILSHGHIENDLAWNIAIPFPASIDNKNPKTEWIKVPTFSVLIEHPDLGYVLYDTGSCPGDEANRLPSLTKAYFPYYAKREEFLDKRLESLNISPEEISTIVVSHMHWDHSGGLKFFSNTKDAKNIYVHKKDFMYGLCVTHQSTAKFAGGGYFKDNFEFENLNFNLIEEDQNLADGLDLVALEGHTPGILGLLIRLESGNYIFPSDAVYTAKNYGPPAINPGIIYDTLGFQRTITKLNLLQKKYNAKLIFPHDPKQFSNLKLAPFFYE